MECSSDKPIAEYDLAGSDTRNGLILLSVMALITFVISIYCAVKDQYKNAICLGFVSLTMFALLGFANKRYRLKIKFWFTSTTFFHEENGRISVYSLESLETIRLTNIGDGSYKVAFSDGRTHWFHADGRSQQFVYQLAKHTQIKIKE